MRHLLDRFYAALMALAALALLGTFVCVMLGIIDRQVGWGLRGLDAYAGYGIAAALFLALPATLQKGEHIRVTLLLQRLPVAWRSGLAPQCGPDPRRRQRPGLDPGWANAAAVRRADAVTSAYASNLRRSPCTCPGSAPAWPAHRGGRGRPVRGCT